MLFWKRKRSVTEGREPGSLPSAETATATRLSNSFEHHEESVEAAHYGMFIAQNKPSDASKIVDIVAIHGLNGHYQKTWTETTSLRKVNWLQDLLPEQLPNARIMLYSYNSAVAFSKAAAGIKTFAEQLLEDLMAWRLTSCERERPIIFVCHSLGGIVFKQALVRAHERDRFTNLLSHIRGVAFFGTPHRGTDLADWGSMLANIIKSASFGTRTNTKLLNELRSGSEILQDISKSFVDRSKDLVIFSFYETDKMDYLNCKVVPEQSAILNLPNETSIAINGNHRTICRFSDVNEQRYRNVWVNLQNMATADIHKTLSEEEKACFLTLYTSDYESHRSRNPSPTIGTCLWILKHEKYKHWEESLESSLLWISADAGCGKSVLTTFLIDAQVSQKPKKPKSVCYFFFKNDNDEQKFSTYALCAILHQIYTFQPKLLKHASLQFARKGSTFTKQFDTLWGILKATVEDSEANDIICFIDGLDECERSSRKRLMISLANYFKAGQAHLTTGPFLKVIITSRPDNSIKTAFQNLAGIRLRGEDETIAISHDVELVVRAGISKMEGSGPPKELLADLQGELIKGADRTFLWTTLTIKLLADASERGASKRELDEILRSRDIDEVYARLLEGSASPSQAKTMLQIVIAAARPLTLDEMNVAMAIPSENAARAHPRSGPEIRLAKAHPPKIVSLEVLDSHLKLSFENFVKSLCGHFLRIIHQRIYFVHQTAREYLLGPDFVVEKINRLAAPIPSFSMEEVELEKTVEETDRLNAQEPLLELPRIDIGKGPLQHSITIYGSIQTLLDICVSYLYLFTDRSQYSDDAPVRKFLGYAANYWNIHFKEVNDVGRLDVRNPRYLFLADPEFGGFEVWTSAHTSYRLNFPGRMHIPGAAAASDHRRELQKIFGLEEPFPSCEKIEADKYISIDHAIEYEDQDTDETDASERQAGGQDEDEKEISRLPDRFQRYQHLRSLQIQAEGVRSMSHPARGNSFPVRGGILVLETASLKSNDFEGRRCHDQKQSGSIADSLEKTTKLQKEKKKRRSLVAGTSG